MFRSLVSLLAQIGPEDGGQQVANELANNPPPQQAPDGGLGGMGFWIPMLLALGLMLLLMRPRKADTELKKKLEELKKNDRVITAGGIIGTVVAIRDDNNSVTLRIDEATNAKMQVLKSSIIKVMGDEKSAAASE